MSGRQRRFIKGQKYTLLAHRENLTLSGRRALKTLLAANKRLNTAYLLKESFGQLWDYGREGWARRFFEHWRAALKWQRLRPYEQFAAMIERHWEGIAAYCRPENKVALGLRRGAEQQDPRAPAPRVRAARRRVPPPQDPHVHAAGDLTVPSYPQVPEITHTTSRRAFFIDVETHIQRPARLGTADLHVRAVPRAQSGSDRRLTREGRWGSASQHESHSV